MKAFPYFREIESPKDGFKAYVSEDGMDLRDYFAAAAMQGLMAEPCWAGIENEDIAEECYKMADEMMKAREQ